MEPACSTCTNGRVRTRQFGVSRRLIVFIELHSMLWLLMYTEEVEFSQSSLADVERAGQSTHKKVGATDPQ